MDTRYKMPRLVGTRHKMVRLSAAPSAVPRLSRPSPRDTTSAIVHVSAPLVVQIRLARLLTGFISKIIIKKVK
jgi:hypothetical protein